MTDNHLGQTATDLLAILKFTSNIIPALDYGSPTTDVFIHIAQILKRLPAQSIEPTPTYILDPIPVPSPNHVPSPSPNPSSITASSLRVNIKYVAQSPRVSTTHDKILTRLIIEKYNSKSPHQDKYNKVKRWKHLPPTNFHKYFTRSRINLFMVQSVIGLDTGFKQHIFSNIVPQLSDPRMI